MPTKGLGYALIAVAALALLAAGCPKNTVSQGAEGFNYPATWPLAELTVPAGATQIKLHDSAHHSKDEGWTIDAYTIGKGVPQERAEWQCAFTYDGDVNALQAHFDRCLKPLGFELSLAGNLPKERRRYINAERTEQVEVEYVSLQPPPESGMPSWLGYNLRVTKWVTPKTDVPATQPIP